MIKTQNKANNGKNLNSRGVKISLFDRISCKLTFVERPILKKNCAGI